MAIYQIDPLTDQRWDELVRAHPRASVFHTVAWMKALYRTYRYTPVAFTTSPPGSPLANGLAFCDVRSWLTGRRLVSLPFSDHCEPLVDDPADVQKLVAGLQQRFHEQNWRYVELRPLQNLPGGAGAFQASETYCLHQLDLNPDLETLFRRLHKDSTQRKVRRGEREGLTIQQGQSEALLDAFCHLQLVTRRRHQLPPQPRQWFRNLIDSFGEALEIRVASKDGRPIAALLTLQSKDTFVYKYGCSDETFHNLGGIPLLMWRSIEDAKRRGLRVFDFGRSDTGNSGLITFKDRWGTQRSTLTYLRYPAGAPPSEAGWKLRLAKRIFERTPNSLLSAAGTLLYKHMG
jgi:CelD/BcsL family acetyltransferase involved in cellulose biosynthesis